MSSLTKLTGKRLSVIKHSFGIQPLIYCYQLQQPLWKNQNGQFHDSANILPLSNAITARSMSSGAGPAHSQAPPPPPPPPPRPRRRGAFRRRFYRRLIFYCGLFGAWMYFIDADFITYFTDLYRSKYKNDDSCFENQTLWIVGASSGIGEYLAYEAVKNKAKKIIISARRGEQLERVKQECLKLNENCQIIVEPLDVGEFAERNKELNDNYVENLLKTHGDIDVLILNSGITQASNAISTDIDVMKHLININILGVAGIATSLIRSLKSLNYINDNIKSIKNKPKHSIAVTSSISGKIGSPQRSLYALTKHGLNGYFESLRTEVFLDNINVNIICPGPVETTRSSRGTIGNSKDEMLQRGVGVPQNFMKIERSAQLYCTAIKYNIAESWQSTQPTLLYAYMRQYLSAFMIPLTKLLAPMFMEKSIK